MYSFVVYTKKMDGYTKRSAGDSLNHARKRDGQFLPQEKAMIQLYMCSVITDRLPGLL